MKDTETLVRLIDIAPGSDTKFASDTKVDDAGLPSEIQVLLPGSWKTASQGNFDITNEDLDEFVANFNDGARKGVPIDREHKTDEGAVGWVTSLINRAADGLWATVEWTSRGAKYLTDKEYKYFSPEFAPVYQDPETGEKKKNVFIGGAVTNRPLLKGLNPIVAHDKLTPKKSMHIVMAEDTSTKGDSDMPTLEEVLAKDPTAINDDDRKVLAANYSKLSDEDKKKFDVKDPEAKAEEEKPAEEKKEEEAKPEEAKPEEAKPEEAKPEEKVEASETVTVKASEFEATQRMAKEGATALAKLELSETKDKVKSYRFSENGENGGRLPDELVEDVAVLANELTTDQKTKLFGIIEKLPQRKLFGESGSGETPAAVKASDTLVAAARKLMEADKTLQFSEALKKAGAENKELAKEVTGN